MMPIAPVNEQEMLLKFRTLPQFQQKEVFDFIAFMQSTAAERAPIIQESQSARQAVEQTWGTFTLDLDLVKYFAEDKELEVSLPADIR